ncbi:hypothetical protein IE81DRAFT_323411 [Ceraceosorus guamensis]|uniref:Arginine N-methyltransferase 2 n=1 Tax=Ceraceosorus guamensis TaxID=1522189 RepID=A0A316VZZ7_9BASI|nr:hypothetical protein IE81DRAFT_323411 [Ceraceosorus guamensis]PWN42448.1 hypothetical protein IE81DRAFT_323411 [Ceraceosorus guamensis]
MQTEGDASSSDKIAESSQHANGLSASRLSLNLHLHQACEAGNLDRAKECLERGADAWWEDEGTIGWSALHFAAESGNTKLVRFLLRRGALWNAVDSNGITAAEVAWSLNDAATYRAIMDEGVRQTMLRNALDQRARVEAAEDAAAEETGADAEGMLVEVQADGHLVLRPDAHGEVSANNEAFLSSKLSFERGEDGLERCVDVDGGVVMAGWETDIMEKTAELLCAGQEEGFSVLNIGFGLGIIDTLFQNYKPGRHVIVEPHADVVAHLRAQGWQSKPGVQVVQQRWQECIAELSDFDVIYTDTYSEDYAALNDFFDKLPDLVSGPSARFSFFHGLAGTNPFLYDVYTRVAELDLIGIGLQTQWHTIRPALANTELIWKGTKRAYWTLDEFRIPLCSMQILQ